MPHFRINPHPLARRIPVSETLFFDQLNVGDKWQSRGRTITETDVVQFATLTGDFDPLHMDAEFASKGPFGQRVAHGLLGISYMAGLNIDAPSVRTVAFISIKEWQFLKPIYFGDTVYSTAEILELRPSINRRGQVTWRRTMHNQRNEVVQTGIVDTLVALSPEYQSAPAPR